MRLKQGQYHTHEISEKNTPMNQEVVAHGGLTIYNDCSVRGRTLKTLQTNCYTFEKKKRIHK